MKTKLIYFLLLTAFSVNAQNISGKAYYQSKTILDFDMSKTEGMDESMKKMLVEKLKKRKEKSYILTFNSNESIYKEEKVEVGEKNEMMYVGSINSGALYINIKNNQLVEEREILGKPFLINDHIPKLDWELEKKSKQIGEYVVFKATALKKIYTNESSSKTKTIEGKNTLEETEVPKEIIVTAWYTPLIPVSKGPGEYTGLPGLILELNVHRTTILCYKIILNSKDTKEIKPPSRGEKVTRKEYSKMLQTKMEEMQGSFIEGNSSSGMRIKN